MRGDNALPAAAPRVVVITGASRGLGAALALSYAAPGRVLGLLARQEDRLEEVAAACRNRGSRVETGVVDVQDHSTIQAWFDAFDTSHPIDLLIVNAGVYTGHGDDGAKESLGEAVWQIRINLEGAIACAYAVLPGMRARGTGHLALVTSLAARHPLPDAPSYSASKAGLAAFGEAIREDLDSDGVAVSIIYPGHIASGQTQIHQGPLPLLLAPEAAARTIRAGLDAKRATIAFPRSMNAIVLAGRLLPWRVRAWLGKGQRFTIRKGS